MVGDTDPLKIPKTQHFNAVGSRTCTVDAKGEFSGVPAPRSSDPPGPEMRTPATAGTGQGQFASVSVQTERRVQYRNRLSPAITRYTISADLVVLSFALADRVLP